MRSFLAIARAGSLLGATETLGISQPTLSRRLMTLEDRLGQLVIRKPHGIELTTKGREVAERIAKIDLEFSDLFVASLAASYRSVVKVAATDGLAAFWLAPHIPGLLQQGIQVSLEIISLQNIPNLKKNEVDIIVAFPVPVQDDFIVEDLGHMHLTTFASMEYIKRFGTPTRRAWLRSAALGAAALLPAGEAQAGKDKGYLTLSEYQAIKEKEKNEQPPQPTPLGPLKAGETLRNLLRHLLYLL